MASHGPARTPRSTGYFTRIVHEPSTRAEIRAWTFGAPRARGAPPAVPGPGFRAAWDARLAAAPHANFTMSLDYLADQAAAGHAGSAVLLDEGERHGAMVLREHDGEIVCGYPWRWQMVVEGADPARPEGMTAADAEWFFEHAERLAGTRRLRFHAPHPLPSALDYLAASTVLVDLAHATEEQLLAAMDASRRRLARRSARLGYEVVEACTPELRRSFEALVEDTGVRRHGLAPRDEDDAAASARASGWAEPWHWLLVAVKDGRVAAGLGLGRIAGGMTDGRASGATTDAMHAGTNSQVWWEAIRRAKLAGHRWMNLGGSTVYKREFGGVVVPIHCRLGGAARWLGPNLVEKARHEGIAFAVRTRDRLRTLRMPYPGGRSH